MKKIQWIFYFLISLILSLILLIFFSPYGKKEGFTEKVVIEKIIINAPVSKVYNYLGNSANAGQWSVFIDHITPLNANNFADGELHAIRRCFKQKNEQGIFWDEKILIVEKNKRRRLNIYNMNGFPIKANHLLTEQLYTSLGDEKCALTFTLFFEPRKANWWEELKMYYAAYQVAAIFSGNIKRVKKMNE